MSDIPLEEEAWWTLLYFRLEACAKTSSQGRLLKEGEQGYGTRWLAGGTTTAVVGAAPGRMEIIREGSNEAAIEPGPASDVPGTSVLYHDQEGQGGDGISGFILQDGTTLWYARSSHDAARRPDFPFYCLAGSTLVCVDVVFCGQEPGVIQVHTPEPGATLMFARCAFEENTVMAVAAGTKIYFHCCVGLKNLRIDGSEEATIEVKDGEEEGGGPPLPDDIFNTLPPAPEETREKLIEEMVARVKAQKPVEPGPKAIIRRPVRRCAVVTKLRHVKSAYATPEMAFVYQPKAHGTASDGSPHQGDMAVSLWLADESGARASSLEMIEGPMTIAGAFVPWDSLPQVRAQLEWTAYDVRLVDRADVDAGTCPEYQPDEGWELFTPYELSDELRARCTSTLWGWLPGDDRQDMLAALAERGLAKEEGTPVHEWVEKVSTAIPTHIKYDAANAPKLGGCHASECLKKGFGDCGIATRVFTMACRANNIPIRELQLLCSEPTGFPHDGSGDVMISNGSTHCMSEVWIEGAGWMIIETQGGRFNASTGQGGYEDIKKIPDFLWTTCNSTVLSEDRIFDADMILAKRGAQDWIDDMFFRFDKDKDGTLDQSEAGALFANVFGLNPTGGEGDQDTQAIRALLSTCDANDDGKISKEELSKAVNSGPLLQKSGRTNNLLTLGQIPCALKGCGADETDLPVVMTGVVVYPCELGTVLKVKYGMQDDINCHLEEAVKAADHQLSAFMEVTAQAHYLINPDGSVGDLIRRAGPEFAPLAEDEDALKDGDLDDEEEKDE